MDKKTPYKIMSEFSKVSGYQMTTHTKKLYLHANKEHVETKIKNTTAFIILLL